MEPSIAGISVSNFKSLKQIEMIDLKRISLLVGPNSSGKSALVQTILLLKQTLESRNIETPLTLSGKYLDLGSYNDVIFLHHTEQEIEISLRIRYQNRQFGTISIRIGLDQKEDRLFLSEVMVSADPRSRISIKTDGIRIMHNDRNIATQLNIPSELTRRNFLNPLTLPPQF